MLKTKINLSDLNSDGSTNILMGNLFYPNPNHGEELLQEVDKLSKEYINKHIDYEKLKVYPKVSETNNDILEYICFKLHLYENNMWDINTSTIDKIFITDNDIETRSNKIDKTFIRLSFYDSDDLNTQNLLYYSTIFLDSYDLFWNYINGLNSTELPIEFKTINLTTTNKNKSSDGFYIYLFKEDLKNNLSTIYLKVELNNAANGKVSLFLKIKVLIQMGLQYQN